LQRKLGCPSATNGSSPYPVTDSLYQIIVSQDEFCCNFWDEFCQSFYNEIENGGVNPPSVDCPILTNGNAPYSLDDSYFLQVITVNPDCCEEWRANCEIDYRAIKRGSEIRIFIFLVD